MQIKKIISMQIKEIISVLVSVRDHLQWHDVVLFSFCLCWRVVAVWHYF